MCHTPRVPHTLSPSTLTPYRGFFWCFNLDVGVRVQVGGVTPVQVVPGPVKHGGGVIECQSGKGAVKGVSWLTFLNSLKCL